MPMMISYGNEMLRISSKDSGKLEYSKNDGRTWNQRCATDSLPQKLSLGSAAGSIVNYCLGISQIDPLKYGLLFERFLNTNPSCYPFPDIDTDGDERLFDEMLCYLPHRYGRNCVARIANHLCGIVISSEDITKHFETTTYINSEGQTTSTFQFSCEGMQRIFRQMPSITFTDLVAINAPYRPGPLEWIPVFIARKQGEKPIAYPIAETECVLSETYGLLVYQEQIMQLALLLAGFTLNESDRLHKSLLKKKVDHPQFKEKFISAATTKISLDTL